MSTNKSNTTDKITVNDDYTTSIIWGGDPNKLPRIINIYGQPRTLKSRVTHQFSRLAEVHGAKLAKSTCITGTQPFVIELDGVSDGDISKCVGWDDSSDRSNSLVLVISNTPTSLHNSVKISSSVWEGKDEREALEVILPELVLNENMGDVWRRVLSDMWHHIDSFAIDVNE